MLLSVALRDKLVDALAQVLDFREVSAYHFHAVVVEVFDLAHSALHERAFDNCEFVSLLEGGVVRFFGVLNVVLG